MQTATTNLSTDVIPRLLPTPATTTPRPPFLRANSLSAQFELHSTQSPERAHIERYIAEQFRAAYDASIREFMPQLLSLHCRGQLSAVVGIRSAEHQSLFLEQYFPRLIEQVIRDATGQAVCGSRVAEIGNLAGTHRGSSQLLFITLIAILHKSGFEWITFTATPFVERSLRRMGIELYTLGKATVGLLDKAGPDEWGSYYDCQPNVLAGKASAGVIALNNSRPLARLLSQHHERITTLASALSNNLSNDQRSLTA